MTNFPLRSLNRNALIMISSFDCLLYYAFYVFEQSMRICMATAFCLDYLVFLLDDSSLTFWNTGFVAPLFCKIYESLGKLNITIFQTQEKFWRFNIQQKKNVSKWEV